MKKFSESTGHKDLEGNWVNETPQAKLRNQLGPFWTLVDLLSEERLRSNLHLKNQQSYLLNYQLVQSLLKV